MHDLSRRELKIASSRRASPTASTSCRRRRPADRDVHVRRRSPELNQDLRACSRPASVSSASCAIGTAARTSCASCVRAKARSMRRADVDRCERAQSAEDALFTSATAEQLDVQHPDAIYFKDSRGASSGQPADGQAARAERSTERWARPASSCEQRRCQAMHQQDEIVLRGGAAQHYVLESASSRPARASGTWCRACR